MKVHLLNEPATGTTCGRYKATEDRKWAPMASFLGSDPDVRCETCTRLGAARIAAAKSATVSFQVEMWNKRHPIGTRVRYWSGSRGTSDGRESTTRGEAFVQSSGHASVHVDGFASSIALSHVEALWPPAVERLAGLAHLLKTAPSVDTMCGAMSGTPGVFTRGADAFLALPVAERCGACDARKRDPDSPAAYPTTPPASLSPPAGAGRLAYVDAWGAHGVSLQLPACGCNVVGVGNSPDPVRIEPCLMHRPPAANDTAAALAGALDAFAIRLNKAPPCADRQEVDGRQVSCIVRRGRDALGHRVPFHRMNPIAMCHACAALWHVQMAEQQLRTLASIEAERTAETAQPS